MIKIILTALSLLLTTAHASPNNFSWYDLKESIDRKNDVVSKDFTDAQKTQQMIWDRYKVKSTKKSVKQIIDDQTKSNLAIGLEIQSNPSYSYSEWSIDPTTGLPISITKTNTLSGSAIYIKGNLDFSPIGVGDSDLSAKVALSNSAVDFDVNKRILGTKYSTLSMDAGLGLKSVIKDNEVFTKGFYGYATSSLNYLTENYQFNTGVRALLSKPEAYESTSDVISPFIGVGYRF